MTDSHDEAFTFVPGVRVVLHSADSVELRSGVWNCSSVTLSDDEKKGVLGRIILGVLNGQPVSEIAGEVNVPVDNVVGVIEALAERNVLIHKKDAAQWIRMPNLVATTLSAFRENRDIPEQAVLIGPSALTDFLRGAVGPRFADRLTIAHEEKVTSLVGGHLFLEADGFAWSNVVAQFDDWRNSLVVAIWPDLNPILLGNLNHLAHSVGFSLFSATVDGPFALVGPTVVPRSTPCFQCAESRVIEALRDHALYTQYRSAVAENRVHGADKIEMDPFLATTLSLAAWETTNLLTVGSAFTSGKVLTIYAPTLEVVFHELMRMPGCSVCSTRAALDRPLYSDLRSYLSTQLERQKV